MIPTLGPILTITIPSLPAAIHSTGFGSEDGNGGSGWLEEGEVGSGDG